MATSWFYVEGRVRRGPVSLDELLGVVLVARMEETLVWREGLSSWTPACKVPELAVHFPPPPPPEAVASRGATPAGNDVRPAESGVAPREVSQAGNTAESRLIAYRNDDVERFCEVRLDDGEHLRADYVLAGGLPKILVSRRVRPEYSECIWRLEWTPENVGLFCELFGEPPELPRPAVGILAAVARTLSEFHTLPEMQSHLSGARRAPASGEFFRTVKRYLEERTARGVEAAAVGYELGQAAGDPGLEEEALGVALATAVSEPAAAYSPEAVEAALRIVKDASDRRNMRPDCFLVLQALEDGFKEAEERGDEETGLRLRRLFAAVRDVLVSGEVGPRKAELPVMAPPAPGVFVAGVFWISTDGGNRYVKRVAESDGIQSALCTVPVDPDVSFDVAASRSRAFASGAMIEPMSKSYSLANGSSYSLWEFEDGSYASRLSPPTHAHLNH